MSQRRHEQRCKLSTASLNGPPFRPRPAFDDLADDERSGRRKQPRNDPDCKPAQHANGENYSQPRHVSLRHVVAPLVEPTNTDTSDPSSRAWCPSARPGPETGWKPFEGARTRAWRHIRDTSITSSARWHVPSASTTSTCSVTGRRSTGTRRTRSCTATPRSCASRAVACSPGPMRSCSPSTLTSPASSRIPSASRAWGKHASVTSRTRACHRSSTSPPTTT